MLNPEKLPASFMTKGGQIRAATRIGRSAD